MTLTTLAAAPLPAGGRLPDDAASPPTTATAPPAVRDRLCIAGMSCASCVGRVEKALKAVRGVAAAGVNLATETADVTWVTAAAGDVQALRVAVADAGYEAEPRVVPGAFVSDVSEGASASDTTGGATPVAPAAAASRPGLSQGWQVLLCALLTTPLALPMLLTPFGMPHDVPGLPGPWMQLTLASVASVARVIADKTPGVGPVSEGVALISEAGTTFRLPLTRSRTGAVRSVGGL